MDNPYRGGALLAEVVRSGFAESFHRGSVVALRPDLRPAAEVGDVNAPIFPRSSNKPMQTVGALRLGLEVSDPADLAMISASHRGEPFHVARVRAILRRAGLTPEALQCPPALPSDPTARDVLLAAGGAPSRLAMNCSGKHSGMLAAGVAAGEQPEDYLRPDGAVQDSVRAAVAELARVEPAARGVDGCGAPVFAFPLSNLAGAFWRLVSAPEGSFERRTADAMREHPELVSGTRGDDTALMRAVPGLLVKGGAEGVVAAAHPELGAVAVKIDDGQHRASYPLAAAALRTLGLDRLSIDKATLARLEAPEVFGGGKPVGTVRALWP